MTNTAAMMQVTAQKLKKKKMYEQSDAQLL